MTTSAPYQRSVQRVRTVHPHQQNPNHTVAMVIEPGNWSEHDPFLLLAEDWFEQGTFDVHPHRGIETVTYVIEGTLNHFDNRHGKGQLEPGDVQWMTAGRGVIHKEDPTPDQRVHSLQLWVNLKSEDKMTQPRYQNLRAEDMPVRKADGATVRVFSGSSADARATTKNYVPVTMVELTLDAGAEITQDLPGGYNGFIYILEGSGRFGAGAEYGEQHQVLWLDRREDVAESEVVIRAERDLRALLYAGQPVGEPVVAYGPFVMNTPAQIKQAFEDYAAGKFEA
ncbi:pirin family protein [Alicyclobacillus fastidiosus]|uniref:Pirin family protein n=1 Tax=Alicyclobacillus fastidiosus TaxID=392011 RepID=A0ABY6ZDL5_9BACL|nr:pirin family protein [Alicyclobacillus fastidiosus]WAH40220.1 pirin family protein [Alicyclobacillus fastidiosus]GMA61581.1 nuclease PIN [Alicyclobacillus fastidiosus]